MADGTGLENRKGFTLLVGSNPTPSALKEMKLKAISSVEFLCETSKKFWEASPSPVHGTRLLSGRGIKPPRGFKSLRLRRIEILIIVEGNDKRSLDSCHTITEVIKRS